MTKARHGGKRRRSSTRGNSPRNFRNTLVFLAGDTNRLRELEQSVRQYLAWLSIWDDRVTLNLDQFQTRQAETKRKSADEAIDLRITEAYHWLLVPGQPDPKGDVVWTDLKLQGQDSLATRAAKKLKSEESLLTQMGGVRLRTELDRIPLWTGNHVSIKQLTGYMPRYLYLPRLRDEQVLLAAIQEGVASLMWQKRPSPTRKPGTNSGSDIRACGPDSTPVSSSMNGACSLSPILLPPKSTPSASLAPSQGTGLSLCRDMNQVRFRPPKPVVPELPQSPP